MKARLTTRLLLAGFCLCAIPALALAQGHETPAGQDHGAAAKGEGHADEAHDGGHGEHGLDPKKLAFQLINFGLLVFILGFFGGKAINKALAGRYEQMKKDLDEAQQTRAAAEARLAQQERRMSNLEKDIAGLRASIKEEAHKEEQRLVEAAEEKARRIQDETKFLMEQQVKEAELRFRREVATTAVRVAEELVRRSVRPDDENRLNASFIADLTGSPPPAGAPASTAAPYSAKGGS